jgi:hypothetical protein
MKSQTAYVPCIIIKQTAYAHCIKIHELFTSMQMQSHRAKGTYQHKRIEIDIKKSITDTLITSYLNFFLLHTYFRKITKFNW